MIMKLSTLNVSIQNALPTMGSTPPKDPEKPDGFSEDEKRKGADNTK